MTAFPVKVSVVSRPRFTSVWLERCRTDVEPELQTQERYSACWRETYAGSASVEERRGEVAGRGWREVNVLAELASSEFSAQYKRRSQENLESVGGMRGLATSG